MNSVLNILHIEDSSLDAELVEDIIKTEWPDAALSLVSDAIGLENALSGTAFDLILSDYSMPNFNGIEALTIAMERTPDTPFIFVTGAMGEELAIETMRGGARDYILKTRLSKLVPAISRAMNESRIAQENRRNHKALLFAHEELELINRALTARTAELEKALSEINILRGIIPICASCKKIRDDSGYWNQLEEYFSKNSEIQFSHGICPDCSAKLYPEYSHED